MYRACSRTIIVFCSLLIGSTGLFSTATAAKSKSAPPLQAELLDGSTFSLADAKGKVVLINFWATWCAPCRQEMPAFDEYYRKHHADGFELVAISLDEPGDVEKVRGVMRAFSFPAAMANQANYAGLGRIWRLPLTFVVDRHGVLRQNGWYGKPSIDVGLLESTVTPLLISQ